MCNHILDTPEDGSQALTAAYRASLEKRRKALREDLLALFARPGPAVLELGSGHGHFLTAYARAHPAHLCAGVDLMSDRVRRATKKRDRAGLTNLSFVRAEAMEFFHCLPLKARFQRVFVLFPDPWPKKRHHKNRLLSPPFFATLAARCPPGADFYFRTDYEPYFEGVRAMIERHPSWEVQDGAPWPFEETTVFQQRAEFYFSLVAERISSPPAGEV